MAVRELSGMSGFKKPGFSEAVSGGRHRAPPPVVQSYARDAANEHGRSAVNEAAIWFEDDPLARFVLALDGRILRSNQKARDLVASGLLGSGGLFICSSHRNRAELDLLLGRLAEGRQSSGRILFRAGDDAWCLLDLFRSPDAPDRVFAAVQPARPLSAERIEPLRAVFGLTRAETCVLTHLTSGDAPKDIGRKLDMSIHTVRAHLRAICMRMGVKGINGVLRLSFQLTI